ncbi:nitrate reductase, partial [Kitasatospora aureofaciens]
MASTLPDHPQSDSPAGPPAQQAPPFSPSSPSSPSSVSPSEQDRSGRVEVHGIDHIPEGERRGRARELFSVWAAANVNYL